MKNTFIICNQSEYDIDHYVLFIESHSDVGADDTAECISFFHTN